MKMKKLLLLAALTAAVSSANIFLAYADETDVESIETGWVLQGDKWRYLNEKGNPVTGWIRSVEDDGRGNKLWYYIDPATGFMISNETRVIDGKSYSFAEDGSMIDTSKEYKGAARGSFSGSTFTNNWSNIRLTFPTMNYSADATDLEGYEDYFNDNDYASIGKPKLTYDFSVETTSAGDLLELYYADMSSMPNMDATAFANAMAAIYAKTDYYTVKQAASSVTVGGQSYIKISMVNDVNYQMDLYCRKQDKFMVVLSATAESGRMSSLTNVINSISAAH